MQDTLTAQEIKDIRGLYGLTQKSFAQVLGIGAASMVRYEQGAQPSKANANLIRAARHPRFMAECLEREGASLPPKQCESAQRYIYACVSLDPEEDEMVSPAAPATAPFRTKMDEMYHYTLQQEILNEQAANLVGEMINIKLTRGFMGSANDVFEDLLDQIAAIKPGIIDTMNDLGLSSIRGYLSCATDLVERQKVEAGL